MLSVLRIVLATLVSSLRTRRALALENLALRHQLAVLRRAVFAKRVKNMGIEEVVSAPRSPWQNPYVERLIGSIRRECLDHVIVLGENHLRRILRSYVAYYNESRTHLCLPKTPSASGKAAVGERSRRTCGIAETLRLRPRRDRARARSCCQFFALRSRPWFPLSEVAAPLRWRTSLSATSSRCFAERRQEGRALIGSIASFGSGSLVRSTSGEMRSSS
jgi:hypothetical protein